MKESTATRLLRIVEKTLAAHDMVPEGGAVLAAVSGGPDSMVLLHALVTLAPGMGLHLGVAHLNHGLRPGDAESDEALVRRTASLARLPYFSEKADVPAVRKARGLSMEEAAREVRYRFLEEVARENRFAAVAVGHHADDNAELVLMNLLRGSGPLGLSGMSPRRPMSTAGGAEAPRLIRPLLGLTRGDILAYAAENDIPAATDSTNADPRYLRNRIRSELMPLLRQRYNPNIAHTLNRTAQILQSEKQWVDGMLGAEFEAAQPSDPADAATLPRARLVSAHPAAARRLLRMAIERAKGDLRQIGFGHIDAVLALAGQTGTGSLDLPDRIRVTAQSERLVFTRESRSLRQVRPAGAPENNVYYKHVLETPGIIFIPEIAATVRANILPPGSRPDFRNAGHRTAFFDMEAVSFPLTIRGTKPGDRFTPLGAAGRQKVKKYFSDHKVPASLRACCPVLESSGRLVWLMGYRIDDTCKITAGTRQVLKVEFSLA